MVQFGRIARTEPALSDADSGAVAARYRHALCVLVLWTDISIKSHWVRDEAEKGKDTGRLIPIILDNVEQPLGFRQVQGLDFRTWNYKEDHAAARLLVTAVERKVAPHSSQIIDAKKENTEKWQQELRPPSSPKDQSDVLLGIAIDTSGSMQGSINNDTGRVMSRLESVQDALRAMGTAIQNRAELNTSISSSFRIFAYAFGLRHGDVCDLISIVRASKGVDITAEVDRFRQKHEAEARRSAAEYGGLANFARGYGFAQECRVLCLIL
jgi:TIR domain